MPVLKRNEFFIRIEKGALPSLFFLVSDSTLILSISRKYIINRIYGKETPLSLFVFHGEDLDEHKFIATLLQFDMFGSKKTCILASTHAVKKKIQEYIAETLSKVRLPSTIVVFEFSGTEKEAGASPLFSIAEKMGYCGILTTPSGKEFARWVAFILKLQGITISEQIGVLLTDLFGKDIDKIIVEMEKLCAWSNKKEFKSEEELMRFLEPEKDYTIFDLYSALSNKDVKRTTEILYSMMDEHDRIEPLKINGALYTFFSSVLEFAGKGKCQREYMKGYAARAIKNYKLERIKQAFRFMMEGDMHMKGVTTGLLSPRDILIKKVIELMSG